MSFDYSRPEATAKRLIRRFGQSAVLRVKTNSGADPWNPTQTAIDNPVRLAVFDFKSTDIDGSLVQQGDKRLIISTEALTFAPKTGDEIVAQGEVFSLVMVEALSPSGHVVLYKAQARQ